MPDSAIGAGSLGREIGPAKPKEQGNRRAEAHLEQVSASSRGVPRRGSPARPVRCGCYKRGMTPLAATDPGFVHHRLAGRHLCVLLDGRDDPAEFERLVDTLFAAGLGLLQIRDKRLPAVALAGRVRTALALSRQYGPDQPIVVINDRADIAAACGADGVHLGDDDLPVPLARRVIGAAGLVGRTAHDIETIHRAVADGADYVGIGPCFPSKTKAFARQATPEFLTAAARATVPAFAIGGVTLERVAALASLGITRVAVASAVTDAADPGAAVTAFLNRLARPEPSPDPRPAAP